MNSRSQPAAPHFWESIRDGRFELPQCARCSAWQEPDASSCRRCNAGELGWGVAPSGGVVFSLMQPAAQDGGTVRTIVVIDLDAGPRMMGVVAGSADGVSVEMRVEAVLPAEPGGERLPLFAESTN